MPLSKSFLTLFVREFDAAWGQHGAEFQATWIEERVWTNHMLRRDDGIIVAAAKKWAEANGYKAPSLFWEERRFDLMVTWPAFSESPDGWKTTPVLTIEHEHRDDTYVEFWGLAHWRSALKVVVSYHKDSDVFEQKRRRAASILLAAEAAPGSSSDQYLFISAPRDRRAAKPVWEAFEWSSGNWVSVAVDR